VRLAFLADGESVHTKRWLSYFANEGYDVHLITSTSKPIKEVKIHELRFPQARDNYFLAHVTFLLRALKMKKKIEEISPDILHAHYVINYGLCGALSDFHPFIISVWGSDITKNTNKSSIKKSLIKFVLKKADIIDGFNLRTQLIDLGCNPRKIFAHPWGVNTNVFSPKARSDDLRKNLGIHNMYSVVCARFWRPQYSVETFIRAIPLVLKKLENVKFIMLGGGVLEDKLKELAEKLRVYKNIVWVGRIPEDDMPKYLASADVYVDTLPRHAGIGQTTKQAMSCGTPCIITEVVNNVDIMKSIQCFQCLLYKQKDHQDLAKKIIYILSNERVRKLIGKESRKFTLKSFDMKKTMKAWEFVYHKLQCERRGKK
jgi:glycosyltransferase involved in cell wall biosynthesis